MVLTGTEIKSIRKGAINLKDSFVKVDDAEVFLYNCHISPYEQGNRYNHEEKRTRKLLLNKKEIEILNKIIHQIKEIKVYYLKKHRVTFPKKNIIRCLKVLNLKWVICFFAELELLENP